jgi:long-chain acyl-CoA synthetase
MSHPLLRPSAAPALVDASTGGTISYRQLVEQASEIAASMGDDRELVLLCCHNDMATLTAYAAALLGDHAVALIDGEVSADVLRDLVRTYAPSVVVGSEGLLDRLGDDLFAIESVTSGQGLDTIRTGLEHRARLHPDLALLLSTSGTTGSRKLVRLSQLNIYSNASAIARYLELTPDERPITSLPLHYTFGLSVIHSHWLAGAAIVLTDAGVMQPAFWDAFRAHGCTSLAGVPFTYRILERLGFRDLDLPSLTTLQQAGGGLDRELTERYARYMAARGGRFYVMYGQTEATARIAYVPAERLLGKIGSAGVAIPGGELSIEPNGTSSADGHDIGEVVYRGPNVMLGYAESADDLSRGDDMAGVLQTGDIGYLDDEQFLYLVGRSKRIAKVFGHRISLDEVEALLAADGPAAVVEGEDALWAFCEFGDAESLDRLRSDLAHRLRVNKGHLHLQRVDAIPLSGSGKVDYQRLSELVRDALP